MLHKWYLLLHYLDWNSKSIKIFYKHFLSYTYDLKGKMTIGLSLYKGPLQNKSKNSK